MRKLFSLFAAVLFAGSMMATTVTKTVEELATANSWENAVVVTPFALDEVISVSTEATDANTGKYYTSGQQIRLYQTGSAKMIISAAEGYTISSITLTYVSQNTGIFVEAESGVAVDFENVQSATFTVANSGEATNGQARVTSISVTYDEGGEVPPTPADTYTVAGSDAAIFGEAWNPALTANDMVLNDGLYTWEKDGLNLTAGTIEFKVVKNHSWDVASYPAQNYAVSIAEDGEYTLTITFDPTTEAVFAETVKAEPLADPTNCAEAAAAALSVSANNELYNNGAVYTIEGYVTSIKTAYSDQYHNISFWMADTQDGGEVLQAYRAACASEADAPAVGDKVAVTGSLTKYNTTPEFAAGATFVITEPAAPADTYTVAGEPAEVFGSYWDPADTNNDMVLNDGLYTWEKTLHLTAGTHIEFKVVKNHSWDVASYPAENVSVTVEEDGEYTFPIAFQLDNQQVFASLQEIEPLADPTNCAEAAEAALSVSANNELYNNGAVYTIEGYVTSIKTAYSDQYHNISFWMADTQDGGEVIQAYRAACASEADAPAVGDKVAVTGSLTKYNTTPEFAAACTFVILHDSTPVDPQTETIVYDWAGEIGTTILSGAELATVKIHTNTDEISAIKISSSSHRVAIKPAEGAFQAGDSIFIAVCFNNSDDTKQAQIRAYAADGTTMLFESAQGVNGRTSADDPAVQVFALEAAQDSILFARQGNTATYISFLKAVRPASTPVEPTVNYYIAGSMNGWGPNEAYMLTPNNESLYQGEFTFAANDEFKVIGFDGTNTTWYPDGMGNNFQITEAGDYKITFNPAGNVDGWYAGFFNVVKKEAPIVHQYEVAEAIAAGLTDDTEILVRGIITKMEFKGRNFAKYGSVNVYVADVNGAEGEFEFYNCYSLNADTFRTSIPNYDPESTSWAQFNEVADANGNAIHVGDTVIAFGKYKLYNSTHELNTGCYLVDIKHAPVAPADTINLDFNTENTTYAFVDNQYFVEYGTTDIYLSDININTSTHQFEGDGNYLVLDFYPENANNVTGVYQAQDETLDLEYTYMLTINGTDTAVVEFADGAIQVEIGEVNKELGMAQLALAGQLISTEGDIYAITAIVIAYYDFLPEEGVEEVVLDPKAIKRLVNGQVIIEKAGKNYNMNGQVIR